MNITLFLYTITIISLCVSICIFRRFNNQERYKFEMLMKKTKLIQSNLDKQLKKERLR